MTMDSLLKHYFNVLALKPTIDKDLIRKAFEQKASELHADRSMHNLNSYRLKALNEAFIVVKAAAETLLGNPFSAQDILVEDAEAHAGMTVDSLEHELVSLKADLASHDDTIISYQSCQAQLHALIAKQEDKIRELDNLCTNRQERIKHVTFRANQNYENLQHNNVLYRNLESKHLGLEKAHCELESEHVKLCLELTRWKANYQELSFVISDLEDID